MIDIELAGKSYVIPQGWEEVKNNRLEILKLVFATPESPLGLHELLRQTLNINKKDWSKLMRKYFSPKSTEERKEKNAEVLQELLDMLKWMWSGDVNVKPFESVTIGDKKFLLFEPNFENMSFGELTDAYIHAQAYIKQLEPGEKRLNLLCATVCRPEKVMFVGTQTLATQKLAADIENWDGDERMTYNAHVSKIIAEGWDKVEAEKRVLILVYFLGSLRNFLQFYDIYEDDGPGGGEDEYPGQGFIKNQHLLAEKGIFGNLDQTKAANVHSVFLFLEEYKKDIKEQIRRQKAQENDSNG